MFSFPLNPSGMVWDKKYVLDLWWRFSDPTFDFIAGNFLNIKEKIVSKPM